MPTGDNGHAHIPNTPVPTHFDGLSRANGQCFEAQKEGNYRIHKSLMSYDCSREFVVTPARSWQIFQWLRPQPF